MIEQTIRNIFYNVWPMIAIFSIIIISIRVTQIILNKEKLILYKEIINLGFIIYLLCLFHVVTFQDAGWSTSNFIPFREMFRYEFASPLFFKNVICNMMMFLPYGFFISFYLKLRKAPIAFILSLFASITIETTQLLIGRVFDVDDIILNVIGGMFGFYLYDFLCDFKDQLPAKLKNNIIYDVVVIISVGLLIYYLFNVVRIGG